MDPLTNMSKGYGFVRFGDESEQLRSMTEMPGQFCGSRPIRIGVATPKNKMNIRPAIQTMMSMPHYASPYASSAYGADPNNTTVFVGGLPITITDEELRR